MGKEFLRTRNAIVKFFILVSCLISLFYLGFQDFRKWLCFLFLSSALGGFLCTLTFVILYLVDVDWDMVDFYFSVSWSVYTAIVSIFVLAMGYFIFVNVLFTAALFALDAFFTWRDME